MECERNAMQCDSVNNSINNCNSKLKQFYEHYEEGINSSLIFQCHSDFLSNMRTSNEHGFYDMYFNSKSKE